MQDRVRIKSVEVLSDDWAVLKKTVLDYRRRDGSWETQIRQSYDRGDGAVILPYDPHERGCTSSNSSASRHMSPVTRNR